MEVFVIFRFAVAVSVSSLIFWTLWSALRDGFRVARRMHAIPCARCRYFTNDYRLKCPVQPTIANTEKAIDCPDYRNS
ncbi:hypothetical protein V0288_02400 [Pannus brasiliensis CCIBt3594]|uniref:Secreted protein n=1 Tax=Pannus brasiliensis CCIBt3594 TaxID=1427578 RepID=A0AAW9QFT4_9CHRO